MALILLFSWAKLRLTLCDPMDCSMPGFPVLHSLLGFAQTHVLWVGDAIQMSHPLFPPSPSALNLSQHQGLFQSWLFASGAQTIGSSVSASVLPVNIQGWFPLGLIDLLSLLSKGLSRLFSSTTTWKHCVYNSWQIWPWVEDRRWYRHYRDQTLVFWRGQAFEHFCHLMGMV